VIEPVVNASPLIYLSRARLLDLLLILGPSLRVPRPVAAEIRMRGSSDETAHALATVPWLQTVESPAAPPEILEWDLGEGETAVLACALRVPGTLAVIDDLAARRCAETLKIPLIGTLGVVLRAKRQGRIEAARPVLERLAKAGMYLSDRVSNRALALVGE
jgi:predicted nucleic acid-binding protein